MNKLLRINFLLLILALLGAALIQAFYPQLLGERTSYGLSVHWQREIAFWNLAILPILIAVNLKYDYFFLRMIVLSLIIGGLSFGSNHLLGYLQNSQNTGNLVGAIENYSLVLLWIIGLIIEKKKRKKKTS